MKFNQNTIINRKNTKSILVDQCYLKNTSVKPIIIFCPGYTGFTDWGAWNIMAEEFEKSSFCFFKFNFSHNGGTIEQPVDFPDLEAFGNNNYTKELDDLEAVINWVCENCNIATQGDINNITLLGHSRGGGIVSIKAEEDSRIKKCISLAGVSDFIIRFNENSDEFEKWKATGVKFVLNGRTKQLMPHYYQFYEDFEKNEKRLTIKRAVSNLKIPHLIIHGTGDSSVSINDAKALHSWNPKSKLEIIEGANHVFGTSHPWEKERLSEDLQKAVDIIINFIK